MLQIPVVPYLSEYGNVGFSLQNGNSQHLFLISEEALADLEKASEYTQQDLLTFFNKHVDRIVAVARERMGEPGGRAVLLESRYF